MAEAGPCEPEQPLDELLCIGGPYAGRQVQVRRHETTVRMLAPISIEELDLSIQAAFDGGPGLREMAVEIITYERVSLCEAHPGPGEPDRFDVLAPVGRGGPVLRELLAGYSRVRKVMRKA